MLAAEASLVGLDPLIGSLKHRVYKDIAYTAASAVAAIPVVQYMTFCRSGVWILRYLEQSGSKAAQARVQSKPVNQLPTHALVWKKLANA